MDIVLIVIIAMGGVTAWLSPLQQTQSLPPQQQQRQRPRQPPPSSSASSPASSFSFQPSFSSSPPFSSSYRRPLASSAQYQPVVAASIWISHSSSWSASYPHRTRCCMSWPQAFSPPASLEAQRCGQTPPSHHLGAGWGSPHQS